MPLGSHPHALETRPWGKDWCDCRQRAALSVALGLRKGQTRDGGEHRRVSEPTGPSPLSTGRWASCQDGLSHCPGSQALPPGVDSPGRAGAGQDSQDLQPPLIPTLEGQAQQPPSRAWPEVGLGLASRGSASLPESFPLSSTHVSIQPHNSPEKRRPGEECASPQVRHFA